MISDWAAVAVALVSVVILRYVVKRINRPNYFPGPPKLPYIGNLLQMPTTEGWVTYLNWQKAYGNQIYLEVMGQPLLILNDYQSCVDLLEKRAENNSDRPQTVVSNKIMGWENTVVTCPYDDRWRRYRRLISQSFRKSAVNQFFPIMEREVGRFLGALLEEPENYMEHFRFAAARSFLLNLYGIEIKTANDPLITVAEKAMEMAVVGAQPGNFLVDFFPSLQLFPEWFPGAGWKRFARIGKELTEEMVNKPYNITVESMKSGHYEHSFVASNLEKKEDPFQVKWCSSTLLSAGTDTSVASMHSFFLAMTLHPEVQRKAQAEIDSVIGSDRLPLVDDREHLPYLNALLRELVRWQPVSPLALPHQSMKDDVYKGHFIPAGTIILGNSWATTRNPEIYENPENFNPDRFLPMFDKSIPHKPEDIPLDPMEYGFGYGRRICAGIHYAEAMFFIGMARVLATFDIKKAKGDDGIEITPEINFNSSIVRETLPFKCSITSRSPAARALAVANSNVGL
ncbi:cytochrome P450 [Crepidotus variabilis]|uniref:Cytochrome P450 n=1 Tax=Crepidotus variabilis TaxID=179855 RepID=A0A9P6JNR1_9AGAR|nr:cytochrome P450 [Crepidotus variabilis]